MTEILCPQCHGDSLYRGQGQLDQSGDTYLPTVIWSCACCGYMRYEPAQSARWRPTAEPAPAVSHVPTRRAEPVESPKRRAA